MAKKMFILILFLCQIFWVSPAISGVSLSGGGGGGAAGDSDTDTTNFDGNLSATEDTVQKSLDVLDDVIGVGDTTETNQDDAWKAISDGTGTETFITVTYQDGTNDVDFVVPVLDEDNMGTDSAAHLATQQSIKAYVDTTYLPLGGGTLTGELTADELGIEFQETDGISDCSSFAATGGGIFYDDSEGIFKKCEDNSLTDLDTGDLTAANNLSDVANAATSAGNLGVGTADSPQFTAVNVGHATDTTITRTGAGDLAVEGNHIYRVGGTDVSDADMVNAHSHAADSIDAITEIAAGLKSGADTTLITGTSGANTDCAEWNADGDLVSSGSGCGGAAAPTNITPVDTADQNSAFYPLLVDGATGSQATETDGELTYNPSTDILSVGSVLTASVEDPIWHMDALDAQDTDWWMGVNADAGASSDDSWELRRSATPGTSVDFRTTLNGSLWITQDYEELQMPVIGWTTDATVADGHFYFRIGKKLAGLNLVYVHAEVITAGTTGTLNIDLYNVTQTADILSTNLTVDTTESGSDTAAAAAVIDAAQDDMTENDVIRIDIDAIHTTASKGLIVTLGFDIP